MSCTIVFSLFAVLFTTTPSALAEHNVLIREPAPSWWTLGSDMTGHLPLSFDFERDASLEEACTALLILDGSTTARIENFEDDGGAWHVTGLQPGHRRLGVAIQRSADGSILASHEVEIEILSDTQDPSMPLTFGGLVDPDANMDTMPTPAAAGGAAAAATGGGGGGDGNINGGGFSLDAGPGVLPGQDVGPTKHLHGGELRGCDGVCTSRPVKKLDPNRRASLDNYERQFNQHMTERAAAGNATSWGPEGLTTRGQGRNVDEPWTGPGTDADVHFIVIVPMYNVEEWVWRNIRSLRLQRYKNFQVVIVDDASTDNTAALARREIGGDDRFLLVQRSTRHLALENTVYAINASNGKPEDVIVVLDGDDWLFDENALGYLADAYSTTGCWVTYGMFLEFPTTIIPEWIVDFPDWVFQQKAFRGYNWTSTNPRTYKKFLFDSVNDDDLRFPNNRSYFRAAADVAVMMPILEMAGHRIRRMPELLVVYNIANNLNDYKANFDAQIWTGEHVRFLPKYARLPGSRHPNRGEPKVQISQPKDGGIYGTDFEIEVHVRDFFMPEEGHMEIMANDRLLARFENNSAWVAVKEVGVGQYNLRAEILDKDGELLDQYDEVNFETVPMDQLEAVRAARRADANGIVHSKEEL